MIELTLTLDADGYRCLINTAFTILCFVISYIFGYIIYPSLPYALLYFALVLTISWVFSAIGIILMIQQLLTFVVYDDIRRYSFTIFYDENEIQCLEKQRFNLDIMIRERENQEIMKRL
jgi:hypothetical protein